AETQLSRGGIDRIGQDADSNCFVETGDRREELRQRISNHAAAVQMCLDQLTGSEAGCLSSVDDVAGIGFKAVFAGAYSGVRMVDEELLTSMQQLADVAPAHNPPYVAAMRQLRAAFPKIPLVAALETGFHETIPDEHRTYAVPYEWKERHHIQRWGYHGASHRYISERIAEIVGNDDLRVISSHLGGSSSVCAIRGRRSVANSLGMSPQSGLPHNNRVGDFDPFALPVLMRATGKTTEQLLDDLASQSGLLGISGLSGDVRDLEEAAAEGHARAELALKTFEAAIRQYVGGYMALLGGVDALVFTGGIGENSRRIRSAVCANMEWAGIHLCDERNAEANGEAGIAADDSNVDVWVVPTNEEIVVARQTAEVIGGW
ncbi:MAG: acetate/propionate family kinase, partial [Planctomycetaceae bacterium]